MQLSKGQMVLLRGGSGLELVTFVRHPESHKDSVKVAHDNSTIGRWYTAPGPTAYIKRANRLNEELVMLEDVQLIPARRPALN